MRGKPSKVDQIIALIDVTLAELDAAELVSPPREGWIALSRARLGR